MASTKLCGFRVELKAEEEMCVESGREHGRSESALTVRGRRHHNQVIKVLLIILEQGRLLLLGTLESQLESTS
jgi:hypothetical protein